MRRRRVHGVDIARDLPCCHRCSPMQTGRSASTDANRVYARLLQLSVIRSQCLTPFAGQGVHLQTSGPLARPYHRQTGFRDPTQQSHASHDPCPALRQWCNLKTDVRQQGEQSSAERWLKKGPQGCPINASEYDSSLRRPHKLPGAHLRSQKPRPRSHKHISTAAP